MPTRWPKSSENSAKSAKSKIGQFYLVKYAVNIN